MEYILPQIKAAIPVIWDRFVRFNNQYTVFGWINRTDGQRDFLIIWFNEGDKLSDIAFATSSAKYSKAVADLFGSEHGDCTKVPTRLQ